MAAEACAGTALPGGAVMPTIRPLRAGDGPAVRAVAAAFGCALAPDTVAACLAAGVSYVATLGGATAGYLLAQPLAYEGDRPLTLWVEGIAVRPEWRRRGVATALYRRLGRRARAARVGGVLARLEPGDAAGRALHERVGFAPHRDDLVVWRFER